MVSRRSVRVKVMQLLYSQSRDEQLTKDALTRRYDECIDEAVELVLFNLYLFMNITKVAIEDQRKKQSKYIKTEKDEAFSDKLCSNGLMQSLFDNKQLESDFIRHKFSHRVDDDFYAKMYIEFAKTDEYQEYLGQEDSRESHLNVLLTLFRFLRKNEYFNEVIEDAFANWLDDKSLVIGTIKKVLKQLPAEGAFYEEHFPDEETTQAYGKKLLVKVCDNAEELFALIEPTLKNWDADRLAILDLILLKMALAEFMYFPTIPTKVTLNEYVEVSKNYSTPKSKDFINGILDKLMKTLHAEGKIVKQGRGLVE